MRLGPTLQSVRQPSCVATLLYARAGRAGRHALARRARCIAGAGVRDRLILVHPAIVHNRTLTDTCDKQRGWRRRIQRYVKERNRGSIN